VPLTTAAAKYGVPLLIWVLLYSLLWLLLSGGSGWIFGVLIALPTALLTLALGLTLPVVRAVAVPGFVAFFLTKLVAGGWDVALRALRPSMPLHPAWVNYSLRCTQSGQRLLLSALVGLLPGTFAARIDGDQLLVHVLDSRHPWQPVLAELEKRLMAVAGDTPT
jgi:multicomponent Na+:H+ antiporter subunit E